VAAATGPDDGLAAELEAAGRHARCLGRPTQAAAWLAQAAASRQRWRFSLITARWPRRRSSPGGRAERVAQRLLGTLDPSPTAPLRPGTACARRGRLAIRVGAHP
jgi:hypothetical protein